MKRQFCLLLAFICLIHTSLCNADEKVTRHKQFVLGLDLGLMETNQLGRAVDVPLGYSTFHYIPNQKTSFSARYGILLGRKLTLNSLNNLIIGLSYHQFSPLHVKGTLQQGISPPLYNANYQYAIQLSQLLAEVKVQHEWRKIFYPYFAIGIGG